MDRGSCLLGLSSLSLERSLVIDMKIKAILADFDGSIVTTDILDVACSIVGKRDESQDLNQAFINGQRSGLSTLIERINLLKGVSVGEIYEKLEKNRYLTDGAQELFQFLNSRNIISIIHSGNIVPILNYYKKILGADYIVGSQPKMSGETIDSISLDDFQTHDFKLAGCKSILSKLNIGPHSVVAIGDSPADSTLFEFAGKSIAINPKGGIEKHADFVIADDLREAIIIIEGLSVG